MTQTALYRSAFSTLQARSRGPLISSWFIITLKVWDTKKCHENAIEEKWKQVGNLVGFVQTRLNSKHVVFLPNLIWKVNWFQVPSRRTLKSMIRIYYLQESNPWSKTMKTGSYCKSPPLLNLVFMTALKTFLDLDLSSFPWKVGIIPSCGNSRNWEVMEEEGVWKVWVNQRDQ